MKNIKHKNVYLGAVTLVISIVLFVVSTLIIIFAANFGVMQQKTSSNIIRNAKAFQAAEAGMEFAINYLQKNSSTILASPVNGYISYSDSNTSNVTLANSSTFSVVYSNPTANNYNLILITSTGTSSDGSAVRVVKQLVQMGSIIANTGTTAAVSKGNVTMQDSSDIVNTSTNKTITSGSSVNLNDSSQTVTSTGGSSAGRIGSDIQQNNSAVNSTAQAYFISNYLASSSTNSIIGKVSRYYSSNENTNYTSLLSGVQGTSVFINQTSGTATINGVTTIGSTTNPVLLIVNGSLKISGAVLFYGFVLNIGTSGTTTIGSFANVIGGVATVNNLLLTEFGTITYSSSVLTNLQNLSSMKYYAKVPGSWKDF